MITETTPAQPTNGAAAEPSPSPDSLSVKQLAQAVLDRKLRPRTADIRRLAEAVLVRAKPGKKKDKKPKAAKDGEKGSAKKRKQAKIPGQAG